jgi:hypothetical protein
VRNLLIGTWLASVTIRPQGDLSAEEEKRLAKAFDSARSHAVMSSFIQTLRVGAHGDGFVIEEIGR